MNRFPSEEYITLGLKDRNNAIKRNKEVILAFRILGTLVIESGKRTIAILKK